MLSVWRYRRFHVSILIGWICFGVLVGIALGAVAPWLSVWWWIAAGISLLPIVFKQRRWWSVLIAIVAGMIIGWQRGTNETLALSGYDRYIGSTVTISGVISDDPQPNERSQIEFSLGQMTIDGQRMTGRMYVSVVGAKQLKRGDSVVLRGKLKDGFGSYRVTMRYAQVLASNSGGTPVRDLREHFSESVRAVTLEPEASLGLGFVVGQRSALPVELDEQLKVVGLTHIVVASGYNLTILVRFARRLVAKYSRFMAMSVSSGLVMGFIAFSGLTPSMVRAGAVTLLSLLAWYYGRRFHPLILIALVAAGSAYFDPIYLWSDIGWYLSFLAFAGVLIVSPLVIARLYGSKKPGAIAQLLIETMAATAMTLPLILMTFERLPVLTLVANMLVAPLIPLAMLATTIAGIAGMVAPAALGWLGIPATIIIGYVVWVVETLSGISWAQMDVSIPVWVMIGLYAIIMGLVIMWWRKTNHNFLMRSIVE